MNIIYKDISDKITNAKNIAIISHKFPDWDALGSSCALYEIIKTNFKNKSVDIINTDWVAEKLSFIPNSEVIITKFDYVKYDVCIFVDVGNIILAWFWEKVDYKYSFIINIDHHASNIWYWDINLVESTKSSSATVLYDFFKWMDYDFNKNVATSLLTWIYTDTWSFMYSNVRPTTFYRAAHLLDIWWDVRAISENFFLNNTFSFVKLLWKVLKRLKINSEWMWFSYLKKEEICDSGCKYEEMDWIVWRLNMLDNVKYVCFLYEKWDIVKWSLRTSRDDIDLTQIVKKYNWWWHKKATWFSLDWKIEISENNKVSVKLFDNNIINFF